jgi:hypothetical protein
MVYTHSAETERCKPIRDVTAVSQQGRPLQTPAVNHASCNTSSM